MPSLPPIIFTYHSLFTSLLSCVRCHVSSSNVFFFLSLYMYFGDIFSSGCLREETEKVNFLSSCIIRFYINIQIYTHTQIYFSTLPLYLLDKYHVQSYVFFLRSFYTLFICLPAFKGNMEKLNAINYFN